MLASTLRRYSDALPDVLPLFAGVVLITYPPRTDHSPAEQGTLLAMAKANAEATAERVDHLQRMILAGETNTACLIYAR